MYPLGGFHMYVWYRQVKEIEEPRDYERDIKIKKF